MEQKLTTLHFKDELFEHEQGTSMQGAGVINNKLLVIPGSEASNRMASLASHGSHTSHVSHGSHGAHSSHSSGS